MNDDGSTTQVAGRDSRPGGGSLPTVRWQAGWRILDELQLVLPPDLPPGAYRLEIGLYPSPGIDLPTAVAGYGPLALGTVQIE
ncbi:MAG: hypothetical protein R2932_33815 [Caldilineaceae bacterium]